jgi:fibronectin-binding autotransporter adhesin
MNIRNLSRSVVLLGVVTNFTVPAGAQPVFTWTGGSSTGNNWSDANNWGGTAVASGTTTSLIFTGTTRPTPVADAGVANPFVQNALTFGANAGAFTLSGNTLQFQANGSTLPALTVSNGTAQTINNAVTLTDNLTVNYNGLASGVGNLTLGGSVSGAGSLTTTGILNVTLNAANTYSGGTIVNSNLTAGQAYTYILANVTNALPPSGNVTVKSGLLQIATGTTQSIGNLTFSDPSFPSPPPPTNLYIQDAATLTVNGSIVYQPPPSFTAPAIATITGLGPTSTLDLGTTVHSIQISNGGQLQIESNITGSTGAGLSISGSGSLVLGGPGVASYPGPTMVQGALLVLLSQNFLPRTTPVSLLPGTLVLQGIPINEVGVTNNQTIGSLAGPTGGSVQLNGNTLTVGADNTSTMFNGAIQDNPVFQTAHLGALVKIGTGTLTLGNTSTAMTTNYRGGTTIMAGTLQLGSATGLPANGPVFMAGGTLDLNGFKASIGTISGASGTISLGGGTLTVNSGASGVLNTLGANITGAGGLTVNGSGTLNLTGTDDYTGPTTVASGTLEVNGSLTKSHVTVQATGFLGGNGTIGTGTVDPSNPVITTAINSHVTPGNSPGILTAAGSVAFVAGSFFDVEADGSTAGNGPGFYDQLKVIGTGNTVTLGGATLTLTLGYLPTPSDHLFVIDNEAGQAIIGTFFQGTSITAGGYTATIGYGGNPTTGDVIGGNSVVLYNFAPVPEPGTLALTGLSAIVWVTIWRRRRQMNRATRSLSA